MERDVAEVLKSLGALGIVRVAFQILFRSSRTKILSAFALTMLLPLSAVTLVSSFFTREMFATIYRSERNELMLLVAALQLPFIFSLSTLSTVTVVHTAASIGTANTKELKWLYVRILSADFPRVWKRLTLTFFCLSIVYWGLMVTSVVLIIAYIQIFQLTLAVQALRYVDILVSVVDYILLLYLATVLRLAAVISVLERNCYGLAALQKSKDLIQGKRITTLALVLLNIFFAGFFGGVNLILVGFYGGGIIGGTSVRAAMRGSSLRVVYAATRGSSVRAVSGILLVGLLSFVNLMGLLTQSVLYFVCKSYHHERIDDNSFLKFFHEDSIIRFGHPVRVDVYDQI